jgi:exodeoxyribonuclease III
MRTKIVLKKRPAPESSEEDEEEEINHAVTKIAPDTKLSKSSTIVEEKAV